VSEIKKIKAKDLYRIGIVVKDAEAIAANFDKYFEVDMSKKMVIDTSQSKHDPFLFNGKPEDFDMKLIIFPLGGIEIELIQPLDDKGPYAEFLRETGGGLHHFNIEVDSNENFINVMNELKVPFLTGGYLPGLGWEYFDSREKFTMIYEICQEERFPGV
jgi:hypothetical protein